MESVVINKIVHNLTYAFPCELIISKYVGYLPTIHLNTQFCGNELTYKATIDIGPCTPGYGMIHNVAYGGIPLQIGGSDDFINFEQGSFISTYGFDKPVKLTVVKQQYLRFLVRCDVVNETPFRFQYNTGHIKYPVVALTRNFNNI